jgi:nucleoid-associated protein EbfC
MMNLGDMGNLFRGAQELQKKFAELQERLGSVTATGEAGGGMVRAIANARGEIVRVTVDPSLGADDREMMEDLIVAATNQALARAKEAGQKEMAGVLGGIIPPGLGNFGGFSGQEG